MEEVKVAPVAYAAPTPAAPAAGAKEQYIQKTPGWVLAMRILQIVFALIIMAMCGYLIHGKAMDATVFGLVVGLMTWIVAGYALITEKVPSANGAYNIWAILGLDLLMAIFWLSSMGANAALRASFRYTVNIEACYNDGSLVNSNTCVVSKRLAKRADGPAVASSVGLAVMSAIAGLSALMLIFFLATLIFQGHSFRLYHEAKKAATDNGEAEMNAQKLPAVIQQQQQQQQQQVPIPNNAGYANYAPQQQQPHGYPVQGYPPQSQPQPYGQGYPQQYPSTVSSPAPVSTPSPVLYQTSPVPVHTPSPAPYELPPGQQQQAGPYQMPGSESQPHGAYQNASQPPYQQQPYSPQGTPAPGQPYYPPQRQ